MSNNTGKRTVVHEEHEDKEKFPDGVKRIVGSRQLMDDALKFGITDFEYMMVAKTLTDPFLNGTRSYLELRPDASKMQALRESAKIFGRPSVKEYFNFCLKERLKLGIVSQDEILYNIKLIAIRCMQAEAVMKDGVKTGEYVFDATAALKAWELMGKNVGMWKEKIELSGPNGKPLEVLSPEVSVKEATVIYASNLRRSVEE